MDSSDDVFEDSMSDVIRGSQDHDSEREEIRDPEAVRQLEALKQMEEELLDLQKTSDEEFDVNNPNGDNPNTYKDDGNKDGGQEAGEDGGKVGQDGAQKVGQDGAQEVVQDGAKDGGKDVGRDGGKDGGQDGGQNSNSQDDTQNGGRYLPPSNQEAQSNYPDDNGEVRQCADL